MFQISKVFPPNRDSPVAELNVHHDGIVDIPAEIYRQDGVLKICLFARAEGVQWEYPLDDFVAAIEEGRAVLGD